jgi:hypothetical protein
MSLSNEIDEGNWLGHEEEERVIELQVTNWKTDWTPGSQASQRTKY